MFLKSVTLYNSGDFSSSARHMEQAATQYFEVYSLCLGVCEGSYEILEFKDFYPTLAGEMSTSEAEWITRWIPASFLLPSFSQISTQMC